jgi:hypothetical protein
MARDRMTTNPRSVEARVQQPQGERLRRVAGRFRSFLLLLAVNVGLLSAVDWVLVKLDLLSPPFQYGSPELGFAYPGVRKSADYGVPAVGAAESMTIAMVGDSHSQLLFDNPLDSHEFVLEAALRAREIPANVISAGRGRYSPLQEYLLFNLELRDAYRPRVLLMNFYSGNDFYDMLRPDDRPHFDRDEHGEIVMRDPLWVSFVDPVNRSWAERSRMLWGIDEPASRLGFPRVITRLRMLSAAASRRGHTRSETLNYLSALRRSQEPRLSYPAAFAAQILNQALFFKHFPDAMQESVAFMRHLLARGRAENPDMVLVLASIPSAAVMNHIPHDVRQPWLDTLERIGLTEPEVAAVENRLVDELRDASVASGWLFIDLRACLSSSSATTAPLYSSLDLHIAAAASRLIGQCQAEALLTDERFGSITRHTARVIANHR